MGRLLLNYKAIYRVSSPPLLFLPSLIFSFHFLNTALPPSKSPSGDDEDDDDDDEDDDDEDEGPKKGKKGEGRKGDAGKAGEQQECKQQ